MSSPTTSSNLSQIESHEDRLQRVEAHSEDSRIKIAEIAAKLDYTQESVEDVAVQVSDGFKQSHADNSRILNRLEEHGNLLRCQDSRIEKNEEYRKVTQEKHRTHKETARKIIVGLLLAGGGVFVVKAAEWLMVVIP